MNIHATTHPTSILHVLRNCNGDPITIHKLTITYSQAPNLGSILSCRNLIGCIEEYTNVPLPSSSVNTTTNDEEPHWTQALSQTRNGNDRASAHWQDTLIPALSFRLTYTPHTNYQVTRTAPHTPCHLSKRAAQENHPTFLGSSTPSPSIFHVTGVLFGSAGERDVDTPCMEYLNPPPCY